MQTVDEEQLEGESGASSRGNSTEAPVDKKGQVGVSV